ncbi:MAG TPA: hypothetical protein PKZ32_17605, partial [Candidatus Melainabacteria bacterium]|nr:hypothetical protein [Candidatus Melainabacteria bacterium]
ASIRTVLEKEGADAAVTRLRSEVETVPERDRQTYNAALLKNLQGDNRMPNVLPDMAIAFGKQNSGQFMEVDRWKSLSNERIVNPDKLSSTASRESNPIYQELYREMFNKYRSLRSESGGVLPESRLQSELAKDQVRADNRRQFGLLAATPKLFDAVASGGEITKDSIKAFQEKWNQTGQTGADFRKQFASTPEQQRQIGQTIDNLNYAFDEDRHKGNKPGSVLKDNVMGAFGSGYAEWASPYGKMTKDSLLNGLGYRSMDEARMRLPADAGGKPLPDVVSLPNYDNTKLLGKKDGPTDLARRMLSGQEKFFKDEPGGIDKAVADLTKAIGPKSGNYDDRTVNQIKPENRDKVIQSIAETGNGRLRDWFVSRYPADMSAVQSSTRASGPLDNSSTKVVTNQGPDFVAEVMLKGSGLGAGELKVMSNILQKEIGVDWNSVRSGTPLITESNLEEVRAKVTAKGNDKLTVWFESKFPKRS